MSEGERMGGREEDISNKDNGEGGGLSPIEYLPILLSLQHHRNKNQPNTSTYPMVRNDLSVR